MKNFSLILITFTLILGGCWDERQYKDITIAPLVGMGGELGEVTGYYSYISVADETLTYSTIEGKGKSMREARSDADSKVSGILDISRLEIVLIEEDTAKTDLYNYIDPLYRIPHNRLGGRIILVEGDVAQYFEKTKKLPVDAPDFYSDLVKGAIQSSFVPDVNLQQAGRILFDNEIDFALPRIKMSEKTGSPEIDGVALFSGRAYTGHSLNVEESRILTVLQKKTGKYARFYYIWKEDGKDSPLTVELIRLKRKWEINENRIDATYTLKLEVYDFPHDKLENPEMVKKLEKFLSRELTKDFQEVMKKLQDAKSDSVGFGRTVRAFHPELWGKGEWQETFSEMDVNIKVKVKITRTGILN